MHFGKVAIGGLLPAHLLLTSCSGESGAVSSEQQACKLLKRTAIEFCLSRRNLSGRYYCEPKLAESPEYYELGLRYEVTPDELVGSNLIGWFGIRRSDGTVLEKDIAEDRFVPLVSGCPFESE